MEEGGKQYVIGKGRETWLKPKFPVNSGEKQGRRKTQLFGI